MLFEDKISVNRDAFIAKVIDISAKLGIKPEWLMANMNSETGGTFDPSIVNKTTGATGLIQFIPKTATELGTTTAELAHMSNVDQLDWVYKYYYPFRNHINSYDDLYLIDFYPNADGKFAGTLDKPDDWQFPDSVYQQNKGIDTDGKGYITIADFKKFIYKNIPPEELDAINASTGVAITTKKFILRNPIPFIAVSAVLVGMGLYLMFGDKKRNK